MGGCPRNRSFPAWAASRRRSLAWWWAAVACDRASVERDPCPSVAPGPSHPGQFHGLHCFSSRLSPSLDNASLSVRFYWNLILRDGFSEKGGQLTSWRVLRPSFERLNSQLRKSRKFRRAELGIG